MKNRCVNQKKIISYEKIDGERLYLKYLQVIGSRTWVYVSEKVTKKLSERAWQEIFMDYKRNNIYKIYHSLTRNFQKTWDINIDQHLLYDKSEVNSRDFVDVEWENWDDSFFADFIEFDGKEAKTIAR